MIDAVDPALCLDNYTSILLNVCGVLTVLLALLDWYGTILATAAVYLQALLIRLDFHLDTGYIGGQGKHGQVRRFRSGISRSVEDECIVVSDTAQAASVKRLAEIAADCFRRRKVKVRAVNDAYSTVRDQNIINLDVPC